MLLGEMPSGVPLKFTLPGAKPNFLLHGGVPVLTPARTMSIMTVLKPVEHLGSPTGMSTVRRR